MDVSKIRADFPILKDIIYMDSASTSLTPEPVLKSVLDYYKGYRANVGRGVYSLAQIADQRYRDAHKKVASLIEASQGTIAFTKNATESINMVANGLDWKSDDKIVTTIIEHHSNLLPWMRLRRHGVKLEVIKSDKKGRLDLSDFERAIDGKTKLVAVSQISNVLGIVLPIKEISRICKDKGTMLLVDGAQSVPHTPINVKDLGCDFLCFSGHKMLGPTGTGVLWMKDENIEPLMVGGGMVEDVSSDGYERKSGYGGFEAGTPNISGGIGLGAAVNYLKDIGIDKINVHELQLTSRLLYGLEEIKGVEIYGPDDMKERGGVISFNIEGLEPHEVALMLDETSNILVRSGHHCCIPLMKHLGLKHGTVRASLYIYNTGEEVERFLNAIELITKVA
ncbi:MAG: aminotransferase class V-fold PLP-dependent enzyme [Methanotrichaceae archaeon]